MCSFKIYGTRVILSNGSDGLEIFKIGRHFRLSRVFSNIFIGGVVETVSRLEISGGR